MFQWVVALLQVVQSGAKWCKYIIPLNIFSKSPTFSELFFKYQAKNSPENRLICKQKLKISLFCDFFVVKFAHTKKSPYLCIVKIKKITNYYKLFKITIMQNIKEQLKEVGTYNSWKGYIDLYFTNKQLRELKKFGITADDTIKEAYNKL